MSHSVIDRALLVSGLPHPLLAKEKNDGWVSLHNSYKKLHESIKSSDAELILYFSTQWPSVIGYLFQANPKPKWVHVDHEWHEFGSIPYEFTIDTDFSTAYAEEVKQLGHNTALVNYRGFPIDTGSIVAQKFLNPNNEKLASMVSCGLYAEKKETLEIGRAAARALEKTGKKAIAVLVSCLSHRFFVEDIDPRKDFISSAKDDEWNKKIVQLLGEGRLEDVSQCARDFAREANGDMNFKGIWWLNGICGESNEFTGKVYDYQAVWGSGNALIELLPKKDIRPKPLEKKDSAQKTDSQIIYTSKAAKPVGSYPHARKVDNLIFLSGIGPRNTIEKAIPGVTLDENGNILDYDIVTQTHSMIKNLKTILKAASSSLENIIDIQIFLTNMKKDFAQFNKIYAEYFSDIQATRTTIEVKSLPTPIAIEAKVIAKSGK